MEVKDLTWKKMRVIERLSTLIKELSKDTFEVDGNEIVDVTIDYNHSIKEFNHKLCRTNITVNVQYQEDLK